MEINGIELLQTASEISKIASSEKSNVVTTTRRTAIGTSSLHRSNSADRRRPSTPASKNSVPTFPSRPCTPPSPSLRSATPARDSIMEVVDVSRRFLGGRAAVWLWPSMRSLTSSMQSLPVSEKAAKDPSKVAKNVRAIRDPSPIAKKDRVCRDPSLSVRSSKQVSSTISERKRTPLRGRNSSDQSENSRLVGETPLPSSPGEQQRWPPIIDARLQTNVLSKSMDFTESRVYLSASLPVPDRGTSPKRNLSSHGCGAKSLTDTLNDEIQRLSSDRCKKTSEMSQSLMASLRRPSSPNKAILISSSTSRGVQSQTMARPSTPPSRIPESKSVVPSVLDYVADARKGRMNLGHVHDAHHLRLLYNRSLQWRFLNDLLSAVSIVQKMTAEKSLFIALATISELRDLVVLKRMKLQQLMQDEKLNTILKEQVAYLEDWASSEADHSRVIVGAIEALKACTLRLPVTLGSRVDEKALKHAISLPLAVMQVMASSVSNLLLCKVESMNFLAFEASDIAAREKAMLNECRDILASAGAMQVQEASLRSHVMQLRRDSV